MIGLDRIKSLSVSIVRDNVESHLDSVIELLPSTAQPTDHCTYFIHSRRRGCSYSKPNLLQNCSLYNYLSFSGSSLLSHLVHIARTVSWRYILIMLQIALRLSFGTDINKSCEEEVEKLRLTVRIGMGLKFGLDWEIS